MEIFSCDIFKSDIIFHWSQILFIKIVFNNISMTFIIDIFQFHCKSDHTQVTKLTAVFLIYKIVVYLNDF